MGSTTWGTGGIGLSISMTEMGLTQAFLARQRHGGMIICGELLETLNAQAESGS